MPAQQPRVYDVRAEPTGSSRVKTQRVAAIFPAPLTTGAARTLPVMLVLVAMFYWLWRIRWRAIPARA